MRTEKEFRHKWIEHYKSNERSESFLRPTIPDLRKFFCNQYYFFWTKQIHKYKNVYLSESLDFGEFEDSYHNGF